ncbi:COMT, partial [Symbiodinium microadriaticum]
GQQWHRAWELLQGFVSQGLQPNQVVVNACISAAEAGHQWPWALELLFFSKKELRPDIITYNTAVSACEKSSEWQRAFLLLRELQDRCLQPDSTSYGAAVLAAVSARPMQWTAAFSLLEEMMGRRITPQLATFTQLLMECELRGLAERERSLLLALPEALEASVSAVTETSASATREDVSQLVLHVAAQKSLLSGDLDRCTEFLRRLDRAGLWNPLAEALWLRAKGNDSVKNRAEGRARAPPEGLRAGRAKELRLCRHVFASASMDAKSVCEAMEDFGHRLSQQGLWLKLAAGAKGDLLVSALSHAPAGPVLEIGSYCGYSAIRLALSGRGVVTLETDPIHAVIARNMVMMAGLDHRVDVRIGHSKDVLPRLGKFEGDQKFAFVFMDQKGSRFHEDLRLLADRDLLCDGAVVVADGAAKRGDSATEIVELQEFASWTT